jgi:hypothetical protein
MAWRLNFGFTEKNEETKMKNLLKLKFWTVMAAMFLTFGAIDGLAQTRRPVVRKAPVRKAAPVKKAAPVRPAPAFYTVQRGQNIRVRMNETISSKTAKVGDRFTATVTEPVYSTNGVVVIPTGSVVTGRVDAVKAAKKGGNVGEVDASFIEVRLPNGTRRAINGSLTDLYTKDGKSDEEGTVSGDRMKHRKVIFIGVGGAGGAVLGGAIGGGRGALIGGILGAGAGLLGERMTKGEEAEVRSGSEFGIYLNQSISLPRFAEARY